MQVTYHVVQVTEEHLEGRREGGRAGGGAVSVAFSAAPQAVAQVRHFTKLLQELLCPRCSY